ncbi:uncharacterized protein G2W53_024783 [Senna tora]|uniref:Uncharacterized protein n=1 Tax=Senna tora TaxID=362788 RepID=A0A834TBV4_9FABA|nr:uncharacterized protein G2W53_024783 [Senna tora]
MECTRYEVLCVGSAGTTPAAN